MLLHMRQRHIVGVPVAHCTIMVDEYDVHAWCSLSESPDDASTHRHQPWQVDVLNI